MLCHEFAALGGGAQLRQQHLAALQLLGLPMRMSSSQRRSRSASEAPSRLCWPAQPLPARCVSPAADATVPTACTSEHIGWQFRAHLMQCARTQPVLSSPAWRFEQQPYTHPRHPSCGAGTGAVDGVWRRRAGEAYAAHVGGEGDSKLVPGLHPCRRLHHEPQAGVSCSVSRR